MRKFTLFITTVLVLNSCQKSNKSIISNEISKTKTNKTAYIPPQCYVKTRDDLGIIHNSCYACHTTPKEPNYSDDSSLQLRYSFSSYAKRNRWTNLFKDRTKDLTKISDDYILKYIKDDNYKEYQKSKERNKTIYHFDCNFNFDKEGFDKDIDGSYTGWRAFAYYPFEGEFLPTNGSFDDILIRLPKLFQKDEFGRFDKEIYKINLLIVEALIKQKSIKTQAIDERLYGVDLNQNGSLDITKKIAFSYQMSYVGLAKEKKEKIAAGLYPKGTEFLHSLRYFDIDDNEELKLSSRMKELRYSKKVVWLTYNMLQNIQEDEQKEAIDSPNKIETFQGDPKNGIYNKKGWIYSAFIEDQDGRLRVQTKEEMLSCMGCHTSLGATVDSSFAFFRKFENSSFQHGWFHWSQKSLKDTIEPKNHPYSLYLKTNRFGDEFRDNSEVFDKFFQSDLSLKKSALEDLERDISFYLLPSKQRAIYLNKAYKVIVDEQSYIYGKTPHIKPIKTIYKEIESNLETEIDIPIKYP